MAYLINENDPDDYTKDVFDTVSGPFGVTGFSNDGKECGGCHCTFYFHYYVLKGTRAQNGDLCPI